MRWAPACREGIIEAVEKGNADPNVKAMVLIGAGRSFIAGADIRQFGKARQAAWHGERPVDVLEKSEKPVVAAIHGYALGGGLETRAWPATTASPCRAPRSACRKC